MHVKSFVLTNGRKIHVQSRGVIKKRLGGKGKKKVANFMVVHPRENLKVGIPSV